MASKASIGYRLLMVAYRNRCFTASTSTRFKPTTVSLHIDCKNEGLVVESDKQPSIISKWMQDAKYASGHSRNLTTASRSVTSSRGQIIDFTSGVAEKRIRFLSEKLNCQESEVKQLLMKYPRLLTMEEAKIALVVELFNDHSISKEEIFTYPEIFTYSLKTLKERFKLFEEGTVKDVKIVTIKDAEKFFIKRLQKALNDSEVLKNYGSKTGMVMSKLGCSEAEAERVLGSIQSINLSKLETRLDCLINTMSLPPSLVLKTPWILQLTSGYLQQRCTRLHEAGFTHDNCSSYVHLLTVQKKLFEKRLELHFAEREALGDCENVSEYICMRLGCTHKDVNIMANNFLKLLSVRAAKIREHLDFLLITLHLPASDVVKYPRVLSFATDTIRTRYKVLCKRGMHRGLIGVRELQLDKRSFNKLIH